jgi:endonuclease/exonuclease/phosphatase (EEP) superfamily protein YafD
MNRIATKSTIRIPGADILVYSLHTESIFTWPQYRKDQYKTVIDNIDPEAELIIVGGDFNSYTESAVKELEEDYEKAGFMMASEGSGPTVVKYGIEMSTDHIFAKGFVVEEAERLTGATASDHLPIWVTLTPK